MLDDKNLSNYENRNLSEVFKELQEIKSNPKASKNASKLFEKQQKQQKRQQHKNIKAQNSKIVKSFSNKNSGSTSSQPTYLKSNDLKLSHIIVGCSIIVVSLAILFPKDLSFSESFALEENSNEVSNYELNRHHLNMQNIIDKNSEIDYMKEHVVEERETEFETNFTDIPTLPKGEEIVKQEGVKGKDKFTVVKSFENGEIVEEIIINREKLVEPIPKLIDLGTSEFLAKHKIHIGDTIYLKNAVSLKESIESSNTVADVKEYLDVKLLDLPNEEWCKVSFDGIEGFVQTSNLTSASSTPNIVEKNRIQRILSKLNLGMELNKPSGLSLNDYKKIFTNLSEDSRGVFYNNYQVFYNVEKKYNINGIFLAAMAIHESSWGTSQIAQEKNNLFGYGSYDNTPYESSFTFSSYEEGIETVAKSLVKYYLNPAGTKIYGGETAAGWYYNGPTLLGINTRYASDSEWHKKVFSHMEMLYNRL